MRSYITKCTNGDAGSRVNSRLKLAIMGTFSMLTAIQALAHDIPCETSVQSTERVICDHAILNSEYGHIHEQQIKLVAASNVSQDTIDQWKRDLYSCTDVSCVDTKFAAWDDIASAVGSTASAPKVSSSSAAANSAISEGGSSAERASPSDTSSTGNIPVPEAASASSKVIASSASSGSEGHTGGTFLGGFGAALALFLFFKVVRRKSKSGRVPVKPLPQPRATVQRPQDADDEDDDLSSLRAEVTQMRADQREISRQHARIQEEAERRARSEKQEHDRQASEQQRERYRQQKELEQQKRERELQTQRENLKRTEDRRRAEDAERRRAKEEAKKYERCKYCNSTGYGPCPMSPHKVHERLSDGKHCVFCGYVGIGGTCGHSPTRRHQK